MSGSLNLLLVISTGTDVIGKVPGSVYTDLMEAGVLGDPYFRFNDLEYRWVSHRGWVYSTQFSGKLFIIVAIR